MYTEIDREETIDSLTFDFVVRQWFQIIKVFLVSLALSSCKRDRQVQVGNIIALLRTLTRTEKKR